MYICKDCGLVFNQPKTFVEDTTPGGGPSEQGFSHEYKACPACEGNYVEATQCVRCEYNYIPLRSTYLFCDECKHKLLSDFTKFVSNFREDEYDLIAEEAFNSSLQELKDKYLLEGEN
jgi:hypothetical protein